MKFFMFLIMFRMLMRQKLSPAMTCASFNFILIIFLLPFHVSAQNNGIVAVGSTLTANATSRPWLSPSNDFAFGFRRIQDKDMFLLAIWYEKIPDRTIVWFNNTIDPVPQGSTLGLDKFGLSLLDPQGSFVWRTEVVPLDYVDHGFMNDTGNFILMGRDNLSLWESFQSPADTLLPFQDLLPGSELISRRSETNFSKGRFHLRFLDNGNMVLRTRSVPTNKEDDSEYYNSQTSDDANNGSASGVRVVFEESGSLRILRRNNKTTDISEPPIPSASENYFRTTLNFDGVFTLYYHPRNFSGTPNWTVVWWAPNDICFDITHTDRGSGACGFNNVCRLGDSGRPICECPEGYQLVDPNDINGNCRGNFSESCSDVEQAPLQDLYGFVELRETNWPFYDFQLLWTSNATECKEACLQDCFCAAAVFGSICWKKKLPLSNGRKGVREAGTVTFLKYRKSDVPKDQKTAEPKPERSGTLIIVVSVLLGGSFFVNFVLITAPCCGFSLINRKKKMKPHLTNNNAVEINLHCFTYKELAEATNGFEEEIGRGSFGIVYKGMIRIGSRSTVAVKKLDRVAQDTEKEFRAEVNAIGQTHHKNLVRLLGFCEEGQHRLLVYDYMTNGTLSSFLFNTPKPSWSLRTQIAMGVARGLTYLHEECTSQIIHCDIKPQNILLDDHYNARISDFGLAKLLILNQSRTNTNIRGTKGYVAPEWFRNNQVTSKVDVYSFGVLLLEIISCRRCLGVPEIEGGEIPILTDWAWDCFQEARLDTLVENDIEALNDRNSLEKFVKVAIWCIQEDSSLRPSMRNVIQMLEGVVEVKKPSCPFPFASAA